MSLPNSVNYTEIPPYLKEDVYNTTIVINPVNSRATYLPGESIIFDYNSGTNGFIDPKSIYISFMVSATTDAADHYILGCPLYSPFLKLETIINSQTVESISQYNQIANMWINLNMSVTDKAGQQSCLGYLSNAEGSIESYDCRLLANGANEFSVSGALICNCLSSCEKLIPAFLMPQIRQTLTLDSKVNFVADTGVHVTVFNISNVQITYNLIKFPQEVENIVMSIPKFMIKSQGWSNSAISISQGTIGSQSFIFNQRFASIKSAFVIGGGNTINKSFDAIDLSEAGTYQIQCGGVCYPQLALNAGHNKSAIIQELRKAIGALYDTKNSMSINTVEFGYTDDHGVTTEYQPGKFYVGFDLCKLGGGSSKNILNGTSSQNSPITVLMNIITQTSAARTLNLILNYDFIFEIEPSTSMVSAKI